MRPVNQITVTAHSQARPGKEKELEAALRAVVAPTHAEVGCLRYAIHRGADDPSKFLVVERWASPEALAAHLKTPHIQELFSKAANLLIAPPEILSFELLPAGTPEKGSL